MVENRLGVTAVTRDSKELADIRSRGKQSSAVLGHTPEWGTLESQAADILG